MDLENKKVVVEIEVVMVSWLVRNIMNTITAGNIRYTCTPPWLLGTIDCDTHHQHPSPQLETGIKSLAPSYMPGEEKWSITDWHFEWVVTNCDINFAKVHFFLRGFPLDESVLSSDTNDHHHTCRYWQISIAHCSVYHELYHTSSEMINNIHYIIYN